MPKFIQTILDNISEIGQTTSDTMSGFSEMISGYILYLLPIFCSLLLYLLYIGFFAEKLMMKHEVNQRIKKIKKTSINDLFKENRRKKSGLLNGLYSAFEPLIEKVKTANNQRLSADNLKKIGEELYLANIDITPENFIFFRTVGIITIGVLGTIICMALNLAEDFSNLMLMSVMLFATPYVLLRFYIGTRKSARINVIKDELPNFLDLLAIAVDAGMGFDQALEYMCSSTTGPLAEEFKVVCREEGLGKTRNEALQSLADRLQIPMITSFATAIIQSTELGVSMKNVLTSQADEIRKLHVMEVKEKASKAVIKMLIPIVLFIFPTIFIILMGPSVLQIRGMSF